MCGVFPTDDAATCCPFSSTGSQPQPVCHHSHVQTQAASHAMCCPAGTNMHAGNSWASACAAHLHEPVRHLGPRHRAHLPLAAEAGRRRAGVSRFASQWPIAAHAPSIMLGSPSQPLSIAAPDAQLVVAKVPDLRQVAHLHHKVRLCWGDVTSREVISLRHAQMLGDDKTACIGQPSPSPGPDLLKLKLAAQSASPRMPEAQHWRFPPTHHSHEPVGCKQGEVSDRQGIPRREAALQRVPPDSHLLRQTVAAKRMEYRQLSRRQTGPAASAVHSACLHNRASPQNASSRRTSSTGSGPENIATKHSPPRCRRCPCAGTRPAAPPSSRTAAAARSCRLRRLKRKHTAIG